jgi:hypothetical protein
MEGRHTATTSGNFTGVLCQKIFDVDSLTDHVRYPMPAVMGKNDIVFSQKRAPTDSRRLTTQGRVVKTQQLALTQSPGEKLIKRSGSYEIGVKFY